MNNPVIVIMLLICCCSFYTKQHEKKQLPNLPVPRSGFVLAYDESLHMAVMFGGQDNAGAKLSDTWVWKNNQWAKMDISGPSARINATMAYDAGRKCMVLFGGLADSGLKNDTWLYNGKSWSEMNPGSEIFPSPRQLPVIVFDKGHSQLVLFGGRNSNKKALGDTWILKGNKWEQVTAKGPPSRASHAMIYNESNGAVFLYSGYGDSTLNDCWEFKKGLWSNLKSDHAPANLHVSMSYDTESKKILVFGGFDEDGRTNKFWEFKDKIWTLIKAEGGEVPDARAEHESVFIPKQGLLIFGGVIGTNVSNRDRGNDTWLYNGRRWLKPAEWND